MYAIRSYYVVLLVFIAVKLVSYLPSAFSSLASLADSVYNKDNAELVITTPNTVVKSVITSYSIHYTKLYD